MRLRKRFGVAPSPSATRWPAFACLAFATLVVCQEAYAQERSEASRPRTSGASCTLIPGAELVALGAGATLTESLQGRVAGMHISTVNGMAGARSRLRLRGHTSAYGSSEPLIFIDGIRIRGSDSSGQPAIQFLDSVDPADVARVEVLRGPAGTTLYGTDASNGVIHVFTKTGNMMIGLGVDPKRPCS